MQETRLIFQRKTQNQKSLFSIENCNSNRSVTSKTFLKCFLDLVTPLLVGILAHFFLPPPYLPLKTNIFSNLSLVAVAWKTLEVNLQLKKGLGISKQTFT